MVDQGFLINHFFAVDFKVYHFYCRLIYVYFAINKKKFINTQLTN